MVENAPCKADELYPHTTSSLKASSGATEGVLDSGSSADRPRSMGRVGWAIQDQAEDYPPCQDRTSQYVDGKIRVSKFPSLMNRPCKNPRPLRCVYKLEGLVRRGYLFTVIGILIG